MATDGKRRVAALLDPSELLEVGAPPPRTDTVAAKADPDADLGETDRERSSPAFEATKDAPQHEVTRDAPFGFARERAESMADFPPAPTHATWVRGPAAWGIGVPSSPAPPNGSARAIAEPSEGQRQESLGTPPIMRGPVIRHRRWSRATRAALLSLFVAASLLLVALADRLRDPPEALAPEPEHPPLEAQAADVVIEDETAERVVGTQNNLPRDPPPEPLLKRRAPRERKRVEAPKKEPKARLERGPVHPLISAALAARRLDRADLRLLLPEASLAIAGAKSPIDPELDRSMAARVVAAPVPRALAEAHAARALALLRRASLEPARLEAIEARYFELARKLPSAKDGPEAEAILREADQLATELR